MKGKFVFGGEIAAHAVAPGATRKILAHSKGIMLVDMHFEAGSVGAVHTHPHEQVTYIISGRFRFTNDGETHEVCAGDSLYFAPDAPHGTECLEAGHLVDVFTPCREDFL